MGLIAIEGIKLFAYHGYYAEEQIIGSEYLIDVYAEINSNLATKSDQLSDTLNYETIYRIVKVQMSNKSKLIETVAQRIIERIKSIFENVLSLKVRISKLNPPLGSVVSRTYFEIFEDYQKNCLRCNQTFLSHFEADCWTKHGTIPDETRLTLTRNYGNNLCKNCLSPYLIKEKDIE
jgi:dihydroneopterin aldolase